MSDRLPEILRVARANAVGKVTVRTEDHDGCEMFVFSVHDVLEQEQADVEERVARAIYGHCVRAGVDPAFVVESLAPAAVISDFAAGSGAALSAAQFEIASVMALEFEALMRRMREKALEFTTTEPYFVNLNAGAPFENAPLEYFVSSYATLTKAIVGPEFKLGDCTRKLVQRAKVVASPVSARKGGGSIQDAANSNLALAA